MTLRQAQALVSIAHRKRNLGIVRLSDLITDMGVGFTTLADHLRALKRKNYVQTPGDTEPRNLAFNDEIIITEEGEKTAQEILNSVSASYSDYTVGSIFTKLKKSYEPKGFQLNLYGTRNASFAKAFEDLIEKNESEPVLTAIAMYTELDSQLSLLRLHNEKEYVKLSRAKLNLEIRNGRLASIAIPTTIRGNTRLTELRQILSNSWSWMGAVSTTSNRRYWQEAMSLGLLQVVGDSLKTMKPTTIDTISWLARKTNFTFINTIPTAPKCSLVLFRESFNMPYEDDLLHPGNASISLPWLQFIWENMADKTDYVEAVEEALTILKDSTNLLQEYAGRIIPTTIIRKVSSDHELDVNFRTILSQQGTITADILIAVSAKPAISLAELRSDLNQKATRKITQEEIEDTIEVLANKNLVHIATSRSALKDSTKLFSFVHLPYIASKEANENKETNAVLRGMKPYLLLQIKELFDSDEERTAIVNVFKQLMLIRTVEFENIAKEYGRTIERKLLHLTFCLEPFVKLRPDHSGFVLNENNVGLNNIVIDSLLYSALTRNDALAMYSQAISDLVEKDKPWHKQVEEESKSIVDDLIQPKMKTGFKV